MNTSTANLHPAWGTPRPPAAGSSPSFLVGAALFVFAWLSVIITLAAQGVFHAPPQTPPLAILGAIGLPPLVFALLLRYVDAFRRQILAIDPVWLTAVQGLRIVGGAFLFLAAFGHLPNLFAMPAGWGDVLVAVLAPFVTARLARDRTFLTSPWFRRFHFLGMLDFVGAIGSGLLARGTFPALAGPVTTTALGELPLIVIPGFAVPLWICLHLAVFAQIREAGRIES